MQEDILIQISNRLKEIRKEKNVTLQSLAEAAGVTKGLISQIENSRSVPSLVVLLNLIKALDLDLNVFFREINFQQDRNAVLIRRRKEYQLFEKENASGYIYQRITSFMLEKFHVDIVHLTILPGAQREMAVTDALEFKFVIKGQCQYKIGEEQYDLEEGDSIYFDARQLHTPLNEGSEPCEMIVVYFFEEAQGDV